MPGAVHIYALSDPRTGLIRYVGKARDVPARMRGHASDARSERNRKACWLRSLQQLGLKPLVSILETCSESDWEARERDHIARLRATEVGLTNTLDGGKAEFTAEATAKAAATIRGKAFSQEHLARLSAAKLGMKHAADCRHCLVVRTGRRQSVETKRKLSLAMLGKNKGRTLSIEHRAAISRSLMGKKRT